MEQRPTGEEIWGPGDWWERRKNRQKINKHVGRHGHYLPAVNRNNKQQIPQKIHWTYWFSLPSLSVLNPIRIYILGVLLVKIIYGSWIFGLLWPMIVPFWILTKLI